MRIERKLDDSYRVLIPIEIRNKLDIEKYEPLTLDFNEETKEITVNFNKYNRKKSVVRIPEKKLQMESLSTKLEIRKRNIVTIPKEIFNKLDLYEKRYNIFCSIELNKITITLDLNKNGKCKYRKENVLSFSEINKSFNLNIHEGIFCNFKYKQDGSLIFIFNPKDLIKEDSKYKEISLEERLGELNSKFLNDGLSKEEYNEMNKIAKQLEPPIKQEKVIEGINMIGPDLEEVKVETPKYIKDPKLDKDLLEELSPDVQKEIEEYRKQLPEFKLTDTIGLKHLGDTLLSKPCPRCGETVIGNKTLKINGQLHCEKCSEDFKNQLVEKIKNKR